MLKIRLATPSDAAALMRVHREAVFAKAAGHYDPARLESWSPGATPDRVARVEREIADPDFIVLVAEVEAEVVGFAMATPPQNKLQALYVKPNAEGRVGRALLAEIEKRAFSAGASLLAFDASLNAEAFYKANGYTETGRADYVSPSGEASPAVQMQKERPLPTA